eukprot:1121451-Pleurochrysis_carterae.AAC.1
MHAPRVHREHAPRLHRQHAPREHMGSVNTLTPIFIVIDTVGSHHCHVLRDLLSRDGNQTFLCELDHFLLTLPKMEPRRASISSRHIHAVLRNNNIDHELNTHIFKCRHTYLV